MSLPAVSVDCPFATIFIRIIVVRTCYYSSATPALVPFKNIQLAVYGSHALGRCIVKIGVVKMSNFHLIAFTQKHSMNFAVLMLHDET